MKSRGLVHDLSSRVGYNIRGLAFSLYQDSDDIDSAHRVTEILVKYFSQFPELAERANEDLEQLDRLAKNKSFAELLVPIRTLCKDATESADSDPWTAFEMRSSPAAPNCSRMDCQELHYYGNLANWLTQIEVHSAAPRAL